MSETYQLAEPLYKIMLEQCRQKAPAEAVTRNRFCAVSGNNNYPGR